jgi:UDP-glucose 4-epimerase
MDIRGKHFLVIGGAGLIGSHCVDELTRTWRLHCAILASMFMTLVVISVKRTFSMQR